MLEAAGGAGNNSGTAVEDPPFDGGRDTKFTAGPSKVSLNVAVEAYRRIDNVPQWVQAMGALIHGSGMFGVSNPAQGALIAMDCYTTGMPLLQWPRVFHILHGKQMMKAETMLARFLESGGEIKWKDMGEDGKQALAQFKFGGNSYSIGYTMEDAVRSGATTGNDNWRKRPGEMLRARVVSKAIRMLNPGVISGMYCPEEFEGSSETINDPNLVPVQNVDNVPKIAPPVVPVAANPVASAAVATPASAPATAPTKAFAQQLATLSDLANKLQMPHEKYMAAIKKRGVERAEDLTVEQAAELIGRLTELLTQKGNVAANPAAAPAAPGSAAVAQAPDSKLNMPIIPGAPGYATADQLERISSLRRSLHMPDHAWQAVLQKRKLNAAHELKTEDAADIITKLEQKLAGSGEVIDPRTADAQKKTAELTEWANGATLPNPQGRSQTAAPGPAA